MRRKAKPPGRPFVTTLLLYIVCFGISHTHAFESWLGEVTANVNLRKSPGLDQEIVTVLEEATIVEVVDKSGGWYQVVTLWDTPEHKGWVYGKHIRENSENVKSAEAPAEMVPEKKTGEPQPPPERTDTAETPPVIEEALKPEIPEPKEKVTPPEPVLEVEERIVPVPPAQPQHRPPLPEVATVHVESTEKTTPVARSTDDDRAGTLQWTRSLLRSLVRLASVILSCLALVFSFKAYRLAQTCYQEIARMNMRFEDLPDEEDQPENE